MGKKKKKRTRREEETVNIASVALNAKLMRKRLGIHTPEETAKFKRKPGTYISR